MIPDRQAGDPSPSEARLAEELRQAPVLAMERLPVGSNAVFLVRLAGADQERLAIYKPARGERPLWDFPNGTLHRREVAAAVVDRALGWQLLPTTVLRQEAPLGVGSVQEFIDPPEEGLELDSAMVQDWLRALAAFDVIVNNADRKQGHLLVDPRGQLRAIDHGVTFHTEFKLRTALIELGGTPVPEHWLSSLRSLQEDPPRLRALRKSLRQLLHPAEVAAFEQRLARLLDEGSYPMLHRWYGQPFEW